MTKKDMAKAIAQELELPQIQTQQFVQKVFASITKTLAEQGRIELRNFGVFEVKQRKARKARNPRTGQEVDVPAKLVVTFKPGREMEQTIGSLTTAPNGKAPRNSNDSKSEEKPFARRVGAKEKGDPSPGQCDERHISTMKAKPERMDVFVRILKKTPSWGLQEARWEGARRDSIPEGSALRSLCPVLADDGRNTANPAVPAVRTKHRKCA